MSLPLENKVKKLRKEIQKMRLWMEEIDTCLRDLFASVQTLIEDLRMVRRLVEDEKFCEREGEREQR